MNQYITGGTIKNLREKNHFTQLQLAERLGVSDKTVSKWETGKGYPDITLLEAIAAALSVSIAELLSGDTVVNTNVSANVLRSHFYICPVCGNVIHSMGELSAACHGITLTAAISEQPDEKHPLSIETVENEYYITINHEMTKQHYISFIAAVSTDRIQLVKLYPEGTAGARFQMADVKKVYYYCNRDGLYAMDVRRGRRNRAIE